MTDSCVVSLDVGGTSIKAAVVDRSGGTCHESVVPTETDAGPSATIDQICALASGLADDASGLVAVGVVVPGLVDPDAGVARYSANLGWSDAPLRDLVRARLRDDVPVALGHDVRAGAVAEAAAGAGRGSPDFLFLPVGTGIAGAVVLGGAPYAGTHGAAGELGHVQARRDGEACPCGGRGCLEAYASAAAIMRRFEAAGGRAVASAAEVIDLADDGDPAAVRTWDDALDALAVVLAGYVNTMDPERIVLGGGLAQAGGRLLEPLAARLSDLVTLVAAPPLVCAETGERAGVLGAAILAFEAAGVDRASLEWSYDGGAGR